MAEDFNAIRRDILSFLMSLRQSVDRPYLQRAPIDDKQRERHLQTILMVEEARIRFSTYTRYREEPTIEQWRGLQEDLLSFINKFGHDGDVDPAIFDRRFVFTPVVGRDRENPSPFFRQLMPDGKNTISVSEALVGFTSYLRGRNVEFAPTQGSLSFEDLDRIVPRQQVAPVQFDIVGDRIVVSSQSPRTAQADRENIRSALEHIKGSGDQLVKSLENSNCDKRLLESVRELQSQLVSDGNVVKIGLSNMACGVMSAQFQPELPDAIVAMLNSYSASVSLYVAQFPEWDQFMQKAAGIALDEDDIAEVDIAAGEIVAALTDNAILADPEVPKTIAFVRQFMSFPGTSSKRAAFAMIRTIENLVSSILRYSVVFFGKTVEKTIDAGAATASKIIVGLLGVALMSATGIGPAAVRAGAPWVQQAVEVVQKQIVKVTE